MLALALIPAALALPEGPALFCDTYGTSPLCLAGGVSCQACHDAGGAPLHNPYGAALAPLVAGQDFASALPAALGAVEPLDSDGDGVANGAEIAAGTWPGLTPDAEPECAEQSSAENPWYTLGAWDPAWALRRVRLALCGTGPSFEEVQELATVDDPRAAVHEALDACLDSPSWAATLEDLALPAVVPAEERPDCHPSGNHHWDLRLFRWAMSDGHDAGDVLQAQYLVAEDPDVPGALLQIDDPRESCEAVAVPLASEHRFGLITSKHLLVTFVGFSELPRQLSAHIYRELLGLDIARAEGLYPVDTSGAWPWPAPDDPLLQGVAQEACAACHSTLDPLTTPWVRYHGVGDGLNGEYDAERNVELYPSEAGWIFGREVSGPAQWVAEAVASDAFARQVVTLLWRRLLRREPLTCEASTVDALATAFRDGGRDVEALLHQLVDSDAWGAP